MSKSTEKIEDDDDIVLKTVGGAEVPYSRKYGGPVFVAEDAKHKAKNKADEPKVETPAKTTETAKTTDSK